MLEETATDAWMISGGDEQCGMHAHPCLPHGPSGLVDRVLALATTVAA